jgi:serine/threonine protein kinase
MGTPQYMAPELFAAQESETGNGRPTKAGDVYALALTSWHVGMPNVIDGSKRSQAARSTA